jgi:drug/metabolite transporter (DMT)-like permease
MPPNNLERHISSGIGSALLSAVFFGISTPLAKILTGNTPPILLAGLLYLGSGVGLGILQLFRGKSRKEKPLSRRDIPWLIAAVVFGGIVGPVLLMIGLVSTPGSTGSLLLNLEAVFTAMLAWFVFSENFDRRIATGFVLIVLGGLALAWQPGVGFVPSTGWLAIAGACFCWALDNNLTQKISASDPLQIAATKGLVAGVFNISVALLLGDQFPRAAVISGALGVGFVGYGVSLALFVLALRKIGTARTSAYFSVAPFVGAILSLLLFNEFQSPLTAVAGVLMAAGVWLHLTESHEHKHEHSSITHSHPHDHDEHHQHHAGEDLISAEHHTHLHQHDPLAHSHPHYPDIHHRHGHTQR